MASNDDWEDRHHSVRAQNLPRTAPKPLWNPGALARNLEAKLRDLISTHEYRSQKPTIRDDTFSVGLDRLLKGRPILDASKMASLVVDRATGEVVFFYQDAESPDPDPSAQRLSEAQARAIALRRAPFFSKVASKASARLGYATPKGGTRPRLCWRIDFSQALQGMVQKAGVIVDAENGQVVKVEE